MTNDRSQGEPVASQRFICPCYLGQLFLSSCLDRLGHRPRQVDTCRGSRETTSVACGLVQPPPRVEPGPAPPRAPPATQVASRQGLHAVRGVGLFPLSRAAGALGAATMGKCVTWRGRGLGERGHLCPGSGEARGAAGATRSWCSVRALRL